MELLESSLFAALAELTYTEAECRELQQYLLRHPSAGTVILRSGGVRTLRWRTTRDREKSKSARTIYYVRTSVTQVCLLTLHSKRESGDLSHRQLKELRRLMGNA